MLSTAKHLIVIPKKQLQVVNAVSIAGFHKITIHRSFVPQDDKQEELQ